MLSGSCIAVPILGLLIIAPALANQQEHDLSGAISTPLSNDLSADAVIDGIKFVGLHRIAEGAVEPRLLSHSGERFDAARIVADLRALNRLGWFEDVFVQAERSHSDSQDAANGRPRFRLEYHVSEYPFLTAMEYSGSKLLSQPQIKKLLEQSGLSPQLGALADPVLLHRVARAIQSELAAMGHLEAQVSIRQEKLSQQRVIVAFEIHDGPRLPVVGVSFSGHPEISDKVLRKQMRQVVPGAWFSGLRNKNVYTEEKGEQDRASLLIYLQNHGFPQARVGTPQVTQANAVSDHPWPWLHRRSEAGLSVDLPVEAGTFYRFGATEVSPTLRETLSSGRKGNAMLPEVESGRPFSEQAVESLQRAWEVRVHRSSQQRQRDADCRVRVIPTFNAAMQTASLKLDFDPTPNSVVRRIEFRGNQRFPDRYLRRRIGLREGQPFDQYSLEAGLARLARTGYFQPLKKTDIQMETNEVRHTADVIIHLHEKGKQRVAFSGGREQFGSTLGIAYTVFNLLGLDEFLSTQIDGGPVSLQLAMGLAKEGFLGSRGTLALSVFDTFLRPHFTIGAQGPFERTQGEGANLGWSYAPSDVNAIGINYGFSRSRTEYVFNQTSGAASVQAIDLRNQTSSHSVGIGWTYYPGEQKIQFAESVSGGWLGGNENLLKSKAEYSHIFPDEIFDRHNAWAFRTTVSAAGSYQGDMPLYARFFSGDVLVRGLRPGELGPYETVATVSSSGATSYSAVPTGSDLVAASNLEYRFPLSPGVEGTTFFDLGSGFLLPNWLGPTRPALINSTNGLLHGSAGIEVRWTLPAVGVPLRVNYSFNVMRLTRALLMPDGSVFRVHNRLTTLGWGLGPFF